ncbi:hypothetical protein BDA96_08G114400 [Sorghum bicolor]|uniref:Uncharacterized protein n=1 Tax=Sorghum bicolor TaxID=4558 RepID=A0A921U787_SORBI|nr:hypothetical protein BDA96_08G114400 [Sorghum bicolor]
MKIPDWSKILGSEYRSSYHYGAGGDSVDWVPPHELVVGRRRAVSLSLNGVVGKMLKVRDAVWKQTTR